MINDIDNLIELQWQYLYKSRQKEHRLEQLKGNELMINDTNKCYSFTDIGRSETPWQW